MMLCYHCNTRLLPVGSENRSVQTTTWGVRHVLTHKKCDHADLVTYAAELGVFPVDDPNRSDQQLIDAIAAEKLSGEWLDRVEKLPPEKQASAIRQLRVNMEAMRGT